jgi:hypothetical protein
VGAGLAAWVSLLIGVAVSLYPLAWVSLFSSDPAVLDSGSNYLRTVAPFYPFLAAGIALYFASQGAGSVLWPFLAGSARLAIVLAGGFVLASLQGISWSSPWPPRCTACYIGSPARAGPESAHAISNHARGSYPQPDWLIDRKRPTEEIPPRVRAT